MYETSDMLIMSYDLFILTLAILSIFIFIYHFIIYINLIIFFFIFILLQNQLAFAPFSHINLFSSLLMI